MAIETATTRETATITRVIELTNPKWQAQQELLERARQCDLAAWVGRATVDKYHGQVTPEAIAAGRVRPYETVIGTPQLLTYGGASALWHRLIGGTSVTAFDSANAYLGVGDSNTAASAEDTDLKATTNKLRKGMDATYPQHTDGTVAGSASIVFRATFGTEDANFGWEEWGLFNAESGGRMLNRKVESLGTKTASASWVLTVTLTLG